MWKAWLQQLVLVQFSLLFDVLTHLVVFEYMPSTSYDYYNMIQANPIALLLLDNTINP